jgi:hypothetical protein
MDPVKRGLGRVAPYARSGLATTARRQIDVSSQMNRRGEHIWQETTRISSLAR